MRPLSDYLRSLSCVAVIAATLAAMLLGALACPGTAGAAERHRNHHRLIGRVWAISKRVQLGHPRTRRRGLSRAAALGPASASVSSASSSGCSLSPTQPGAPVGMTLPGCHLLGSDSSANPNPLPFWGSVDCGVSSAHSDLTRQQQVTSGGDAHLAATGAEADPFYRQLTVLDGDNFYGERCELGKNDHVNGLTAFYHEGQRRVTYFSEKLPSNFPIGTDQWQTVMQMKQAQPSHDDGSGVALELQVFNNQWVIANDWQTIQTFPAKAGVWTRFAWDVYYSQDPSKGWLQVSVDLNGDGDFNDPGERSPVIHAATLQTEIAGPFNAEDGLAAGAPIPSHLRMGIYHDPSILCPAPNGCSVDIDNVQVVAPQ